MSQKMGGLGLGERLEVEAALETAFEPLRSRRSTVGPTRVRAAVRWGRVDPQPQVRWAAAVSRISELGMAVGMTAFVFAAALTSVPPTSAPTSVSDVAVAVDELLVRPAPVVHRWTVRVIQPSAEDEMKRMLRALRLGGAARPNDSLDATVPPRSPQPPAPAPAPELPQARPPIPLR